jgi:hypothetical protein
MGLSGRSDMAPVARLIRLWTPPLAPATCRCGSASGGNRKHLLQTPPGMDGRALARRASVPSECSPSTASAAGRRSPPPPSRATRSRSSRPTCSRSRAAPRRLPRSQTTRTPNRSTGDGESLLNEEGLRVECRLQQLRHCWPFAAERFGCEADDLGEAGDGEVCQREGEHRGRVDSWAAGAAVVRPDDHDERQLLLPRQPLSLAQ